MNPHGMTIPEIDAELGRLQAERAARQGNTLSDRERELAAELVRRVCFHSEAATQSLRDLLVKRSVGAIVRPKPPCRLLVNDEGEAVR